MKIYLDSSCLNRIFDDQTQPRIYLESTSMLLIFMLIEKRLISIVSSEALIYENLNNPYEERRIFVDAILKIAQVLQKTNKQILNRAKEIEKLNIKGLDAIHLASAEKQKVNFFITCDDRIIKRYKGKIKIKNPIDFTMEILKEEDNEDK